MSRPKLDAPASVSVATPTQRLVIVSAWARREIDGRWAGGHRVHDVVAVSATITAGRVVFDLVIFDEAQAALRPASELLDGQAQRVVAAPWPAAEDARRLHAIIGRVKADAFVKAAAELKSGSPEAVALREAS